MAAEPIFIDSETQTWNLDPELLKQELDQARRENRMPAAVVAVDAYGQCADYEAISEICEHFEIPLIEDAAEALGARNRDRPAGSFGNFAAFSFNGNKIITTSGGGMLVTESEEHAAQARHLATQAREPAPHYEHCRVGYNYRLSNLLAAIGRGQLACLDEKVAKRRAIFERYRRQLAPLAGIEMMPEPEGWNSTRWLTVITIDSELFGCGPEAIRLALEEENIEARPTWKPLHLQPLFQKQRSLVNGVSQRLFETGLLPTQRQFAIRARSAAGNRYHCFLASGNGVQPRVEKETLDVKKIKRLIDLGLCLALFPLVGPLMFICAILIKLDGGPVFFKATRAGQFGKNFLVYKFRSMIVNADQFLDDEGRPTRERVTWVGKWMRRFSIDELPQAINILRGEMSFVGPRPILPADAESLDSKWHQRFEMPPGLSGLAQVSGRNTLPWSERYRLDVEYVENYSIWLDIKIMFRTVWVVITGAGMVMDRNPDQARAK